jgi:trehalose 6-phosphate synthase
MADESPDLVVVSNRLPCVLEPKEGEPGGWAVRPGSGGLVTALAPVLRSRGGTWIGWPGTVEEDGVDAETILAGAHDQLGIRLRPVPLYREEKQGFYEGFANQIVWPLFHSLDERCRFSPRFWNAYQTVNRKFADAVLKYVGTESPFIWIHDYHLMLVADALRRAGLKSRIALFLHTPFPPPGMFLKLPWRQRILHSLLAYELIGFQTMLDRRNFVACLRALCPESRVTGRGRVQTVTAAQGATRLGAFPISIDFDEFSKQATASESVAHYNRLKHEYADRKLLLGVDRLDYTKGIPNRLRALQNALERFSDLRRRITLVQIVVPSREGIGEYQDLRQEIDELVGQINGKFTEPGWVPLHYVFRSVERAKLVAFYRLADVCLVTPLNDGMNLVAKEYCACNTDESGALVLSEFTGAAAELQRGAILVNPYDYEGTADAIYRALTMPADERSLRMRRMRQHLQRHNVFTWVDSFLAAGTRGIGDDDDNAEPAHPTGADYTSELAVHALVADPDAVSPADSASPETARVETQTE